MSPSSPETAVGWTQGNAPPSPPRRRVMMVINDLQKAGAETQLVRLVLGLDPVGYEVRIVLLKTEDHFAAELDTAGVVVEALHRRGPADIDVVRRLARAIRRFDPDLVHSWLFLANLLTVLATRLVRVPAVVLSQRSCYDATLSPFWRRVARLSHRFADRVIVNSEAALREELAAGVPRHLLVHVPNGITVPAMPAQANRQALGMPAGPLVVCVAQLSHEKGHQHLLDAWPDVAARFPNARLALVGDGPLRPRLESRSRELGLAASVVFTGFQEATPWLAAADIVVLPSVTEGMPNAVLEAMALGRPVVATRVGGVPELVEEGETGILVPPNDPSSLAAALCRLIEDPARATRLGNAARLRAAERFAKERMVAATAGVYEDVSPRIRGGSPRQRSGLAAPG